MIGLDLSASANLAIVWIIDIKVPLHSDPNIGFDLSYYSIFNVNFVHFRIITFYIVSF